MSWWTEFRDGLETAAGIVLNYYYPGSGVLGHWVNSKGSQEQMYGTTWGQAAMMGGSLLGGFNGNFANYTGGADAAAGSAGSASGASPWAGGTDGAATVGGAFGGSSVDPQAYEYAQSLMAQGLPAEQAYQQAGITMEGMGGASPSFSGQQGMAGAAGAAGGSPLDPGATNYFGGYDSARTQDLAMANKLGSAKGVGAMPWGSPGNVASMGSGVGGLAMAGMMNNAASQASKQADPFGPYRSQYADLMQGITSDPSQIQKLPGYEAGLQAVKRSMASQGYTGSGNMMAALSKYGGDFYNNAMGMYGGLAGAQFNPAQAAQLGLQGKSGAVDIAGRALGSLGYGSMMAGNQWPRYGN